MIESPNERETLETFMALCTTGRLVFLKNATEAYHDTELSYNSSVFEQVFIVQYSINGNVVSLMEIDLLIFLLCQHNDIFS